ncbi:hypothetical protein HK098_002687 [Nowakowskiella sp. JEL0407]|nr:hypothetical protein HK098_002687 [Nowakowskiella sp. JEL0407]
MHQKNNNLKSTVQNLQLQQQLKHQQQIKQNRLLFQNGVGGIMAGQQMSQLQPMQNNLLSQQSIKHQIQQSPLLQQISSISHSNPIAVSRPDSSSTPTIISDVKSPEPDRTDVSTPGPPASDGSSPEQPSNHLRLSKPILPAAEFERIWKEIQRSPEFPPKKPLIMSGMNLDLKLLLKRTLEDGGYDKVSRDKAWREVARKLNLLSATNASTQLKKHYKSHLLDIEQRYFSEYSKLEPSSDTEVDFVMTNNDVSKHNEDERDRANGANSKSSGNEWSELLRLSAPELLSRTTTPLISRASTPPLSLSPKIPSLTDPATTQKRETIGGIPTSALQAWSGEQSEKLNRSDVGPVSLQNLTMWLKCGLEQLVIHAVNILLVLSNEGQVLDPDKEWGEILDLLTELGIGCFGILCVSKNSGRKRRRSGETVVYKPISDLLNGYGSDGEFDRLLFSDNECGSRDAGKMISELAMNISLILLNFTEVDDNKEILSRHQGVKQFLFDSMRIVEMSDQIREDADSEEKERHAKAIKLETSNGIPEYNKKIMTSHPGGLASGGVSFPLNGLTEPRNEEPTESPRITNLASIFFAGIKPIDAEDDKLTSAELSPRMLYALEHRKNSLYILSQLTISPTSHADAQLLINVISDFLLYEDDYYKLTALQVLVKITSSEQNNVRISAVKGLALLIDRIMTNLMNQRLDREEDITLFTLSAVSLHNISTNSEIAAQLVQRPNLTQLLMKILLSPSDKSSDNTAVREIVTVVKCRILKIFLECSKSSKCKPYIIPFERQFITLSQTAPPHNKFHNMHLLKIQEVSQFARQQQQLQAQIYAFSQQQQQLMMSGSMGISQIKGMEARYKQQLQVLTQSVEYGKGQINKFATMAAAENDKLVEFDVGRLASNILYWLNLDQ